MNNKKPYEIVIKRH